MRQGRPHARALFLIVAGLLGITYLYGKLQTTDHAEVAKYRDVIHNGTLGFQKIFIVNLPERTDRRDAMTISAAISGLNITWVNGVRGENVVEKSLPPGERRSSVKWEGTKGCWRGHMNALQQIVDQNLATALILEDDTDWDIRLKSQMDSFAIAARAFTQPLRRDPSRTMSAQHLYRNDTDRSTRKHSVDVERAPAALAPASSPYGDNWDVLWLGHIGSYMPIEWQSLEHNGDTAPHSLLSLYQRDDATVPAYKHLKRHPFADTLDHISERFPPHTRVVHESRNTIGAQAYAVSQRGARWLLWQFGVETFTNGWDILLRDWCDGVYAKDQPEHRRPLCLTTQPPLISHHYSKSGGSDIHGMGGGYIKKFGSPYIRFSVKMNMGTLVSRSTEDVEPLAGLVDQWPDDGPGSW